MKVQIHSQDEPPFIDQLGFGVAPGFQTFVSCQQQRVSGHGARGWAQTPEGSGWAPGGIGVTFKGVWMVTQRDQKGPPKRRGLGWPDVATDIPVGTFQAMGTTAIPLGAPHAQPCHGYSTTAAHGVGQPHSRSRQPLCRQRLRQRPPAPVEQPPGGWRHPAPAARHLNLGASGGCHHVCRRRGGSSTAAAGMWPWHPRVGAAGSSPGMIPALGTEGTAGVRAERPPGMSCSCMLPDSATCQTPLWHPVQVTIAATSIPTARKEGTGWDGALGWQDPQRWLCGVGSAREAALPWAGRWGRGRAWHRGHWG